MKSFKFAAALLMMCALLGVSAFPVRAEIVIAAVGPMEGPFAAYGAQMKNGAELAVAALNAKGGVLGQKIKLIIADDACNPKVAETVAKSMINQGVNFVAGHFCSGASIAASDTYAKEGVLQISPSSTHPVLTDRGLENVYRVCGRDDQQGILAGSLLADQFAGKKVAIVHDGQGYSQSLAAAAKAQLNSQGVNETLFQAVKPGEKDYSTLVTTLKRNGIDVLYYGGYHKEAGLIMRGLHAQGMSVVLVSGDDLATGKYWIITGAAGEGTLITFPADPGATKHGRDVANEMRKQGFKPELHAMRTYAAIQVWAQAASKAGSLELGKMTKALRTNFFRTVLGKLTFNNRGDTKQNGYVWYEWSRDKYTVKTFKAKPAE
ncbi:MAG: branched-chain amino acid ABC transporter substrate-binding protein [Rhodospirillaceae bacterium]|nr:branched-chain amino acid ABC transporter substrate-binding protein [Rhodospirillaceae bacterium]